MKLHVIYRISDKGHNATKTHCLQNAIEHFGRENFHVIADNCSPELVRFIESEGLDFEETHLGNSTALKYAVNYDELDKNLAAEQKMTRKLGASGFLFAFRPGIS